MISIVELKTSKPDSTNIRKQIKNGLNLAFYILNEQSISKINPEIILIVLTKSIRNFDREKLSKPILFQGGKHFIVVGKCGDSFSQLRNKQQELLKQLRIIYSNVQ